jgi:hypothetical protein
MPVTFCYNDSLFNIMPNSDQRDLPLVTVKDQEPENMDELHSRLTDITERVGLNLVRL